MPDIIPVTIYGTVFCNEATGEEFLDAGTLRYTVDGSRLAAKELQAAMQSKRHVRPVRIMKLVLTKGGSDD